MITVDVSEQVRAIRKRVERAAQAILTHLPDAELVVQDLEQSADPVVRMVAEYYRKIEQERAVMRKIRITHDGSFDVVNGTTVTDAQTGEMIDRVSRVEVILDAEAGPKACLYLDKPPLDIVVDAVCVSTVEYDPEDIDSIDQAIATLQAERTERMQQ